MNLELSVTSASAKAKAISTLNAHGHRASSGSVRLAYPFAILVEDVDEADTATIRRLVTRIDPAAGTIVPAASVAVG